MGFGLRAWRWGCGRVIRLEGKVKVKVKGEGEGVRPASVLRGCGLGGAASGTGTGTLGGLRASRWDVGGWRG